MSSRVLPAGDLVWYGPGEVVGGASAADASVLASPGLDSGFLWSEGTTDLVIPFPAMVPAPAVVTRAVVLLRIEALSPLALLSVRIEDPAYGAFAPEVETGVPAGEHLAIVPFLDLYDPVAVAASLAVGQLFVEIRGRGNDVSMNSDELTGTFMIGFVAVDVTGTYDMAAARRASSTAFVRRADA